MKWLLPATLLCAACPVQTPRVTTQPAKPPPANSARAQPLRTRIAWVAWDDATTIVTCRRRIDDDGNTHGVLGPCDRIYADGVIKRIMSWGNAEEPDRTPSNDWPAALGESCALQLEDGQAPPNAKPGRLWLLGPGGKKLVDEWSPPPRLEGDVFQLEASFSPHKDKDGKQYLAVLHLAVDVGEGERIVKVASAEDHSDAALRVIDGGRPAELNAAC